MAIFEYMKPSNWGEVIGWLEDKEGAMVIAGGTDLLVQTQKKKVAPRYLIDLKALEITQPISQSENCLEIDALTTITSLATSGLIHNTAPILSKAANCLGTWQVRNTATVGGNICNASPAADLIPSLMILDAEAVIEDKGGEHVVALEDFFTGPGSTVLQKSKVLRKIRIPVKASNTNATYMKYSLRKSADIPVVGVAVLLEVEGNVCKEVRIALGAVAPTTIRAKESEAILIGQEIRANLIEKVAEAASKEAAPITDMRASAEYRRELIKVLVKNAFTELGF